MFKKKCPRCEKKISRGYDFCPFCGKNFKSKENEEDYGLIGKNDFIDSPMPNINNSFVDKLFNNAVKILEKQMKNLPKELQEMNQERNPFPNNLNVQFFVNGKRVLPEEFVGEPKKKETVKRIKNTLTPEKKEKFSKLPKKEPQSKVRRLSGKVVYELSMPGVKAIEDILINQLENSIEIKALSKDKVYYKTLNINLPILRYKLNKGNLILELQER